MSSYLILKHIHITAVVLSGLFFLLRGGWLLQHSPQLKAKWVKISPHVIDTILLFSAIAMLVVSGQFPAWVHVKMTLLLVYIGLGLVLCWCICLLLAWQLLNRHWEFLLNPSNFAQGASYRKRAYLR